MKSGWTRRKTFFKAIAGWIGENKRKEQERFLELFNQWKVPAILLFYKKINSATWKEQKN